MLFQWCVSMNAASRTAPSQAAQNIVQYAIFLEPLGKSVYNNVMSFLTIAFMGNARRKTRIWKHTEPAGSSRGVDGRQKYAFMETYTNITYLT